MYETRGILPSNPPFLPSFVHTYILIDIKGQPTNWQIHLLKLVPERQITHNTFIPTEVLKTPAIITTDIMFCKKTWCCGSWWFWYNAFLVGIHMDLGFVVIWSALGTFQEGQMSFCLSYAYVSEEHDKKRVGRNLWECLAQKINEYWRFGKL